MKTLLLLLLAPIASAQIGPYPPVQLPGQYPGQYPGQGRNPQGGPDMPLPGKGSKKNTEKAPLSRTYSGVVQGLTEKSIEVETVDTRILSIGISDQTTKPSGLKKGDGVDIEATQDADGLFHATSIKLNPKVLGEVKPRNLPSDSPQPVKEAPQPAEDTSHAGPPTIVVPDGPLYDPGDSGPPKLKRASGPRHSTSSEAAETPVSETTSKSTAGAAVARLDTSSPSEPRLSGPPLNPRQPFIDKARVVAATFLEGLPNYVCQEYTTRYVSETRIPSWSVADVVGADVVYEDHKESYRNLTVNGKPSKKPPQESGAWSTGEFGTMLASLFSPTTDAAFRHVQEDTIHHLAASVYDFQVTRERSNWKIQVPGQFIIPAYKGSVWIDKENEHVLRIEMQARSIPVEFPSDTVETSVDYEYISLGTPEKFLLPVHAETLTCQRGSNFCQKNVIEFRNYHKFTGESTIKFSAQ